MADSTLRVQVAYAAPGRQWLRELTVPDGTTLEGAIRLSGILDDVPEIDPANCKTGIYGKIKALNTVLRDRDRIEIYRPLIADPKESRRSRADRNRKKKSA